LDGPTGTVEPHEPAATAPPPPPLPPPAAEDAGADDPAAVAAADPVDDDPPDEHAAASPAASNAPAIMARGRLPGGLHLRLLSFIGNTLTLHETCLRWLYVECW
jgi:hypothetical protein